MGPASSGSTPENPDVRDWILRCEGFRVYGPDGELLGVVTEVVYEPSARWDRPSGLRVRNQMRELLVGIDEVERVDSDSGSLELTRTASSHAS